MWVRTWKRLVVVKCNWMWVECFLVLEWSSGSKPKEQHEFETPISKELLREAWAAALPVWCSQEPQPPCSNKDDKGMGHIAL